MRPRNLNNIRNPYGDFYSGLLYLRKFVESWRKIVLYYETLHICLCELISLNKANNFCNRSPNNFFQHPVYNLKVVSDVCPLSAFYFINCQRKI